MRANPDSSSETPLTATDQLKNFMRSCDSLALDYHDRPNAQSQALRSRIAAICNASKVGAGNVVRRVENSIRSLPSGDYIVEAFKEDLGTWIASTEASGIVIDEFSYDENNPAEAVHDVRVASRTGGISPYSLSLYCMRLHEAGHPRDALEILESYGGRRTPSLTSVALKISKFHGDREMTDGLVEKAIETGTVDARVIVDAASAIRRQSGINEAIDFMESHMAAVLTNRYAIHMLATYYLSVSAPDLAMEFLEGSGYLRPANSEIFRVYIESLVMLGLSSNEILEKLSFFEIDTVAKILETLVPTFDYHAGREDWSLAYAATLPDIALNDLPSDMRTNRVRAMLKSGMIDDLLDQIDLSVATTTERLLLARNLRQEGRPRDAMPLLRSKKNSVIIEPGAHLEYARCLSDLSMDDELLERESELVSGSNEHPECVRIIASAKISLRQSPSFASAPDESKIRETELLASI